MSTLYVESEAVVADVRPVVASIARKDQDLARKLKRACDELPERIAEGMCLTGRARRQEYEAARKAARDAHGCLRAAQGTGALAEVGDELIARMAALLSRIDLVLENSGVHAVLALPTRVDAV